LEKHRAEGTTVGQLHFPHCEESCFRHNQIRPDYEITYHKSVALRLDTIIIGSITSRSPEIAKKLPEDYHQWMLLFNSLKAETLPVNGGCDHQIKSKTAQDQLRIGPKYQISLEEE
jgi:hypothetical protein